MRIGLKRERKKRELIYEEEGWGDRDQGISRLG